MLSLESGLYLSVEELSDGPMPRPLSSGFNERTAYRALGMFNPSETSDAYFILSNDRDEVWFICNRHLRCVGLIPWRHDVRLPLELARELVRTESRGGAIPLSTLPAARSAPEIGLPSYTRGKESNGVVSDAIRG